MAICYRRIFQTKPVKEFNPIELVIQLRREFKLRQTPNTNARQENPTSYSLVFGYDGRGDAIQVYEDLINLLIKNDPKEILAYKSRYKLDEEIIFILQHYELQKCKHEEKLPETVIEKLQKKYELSQQLARRYPQINKLAPDKYPFTPVQISYYQKNQIRAQSNIRSI